MTGRVMNRTLRRDMENGGGYRIRDYVSRLGVVGKYRVRLHLRANGIPVRETFSQEDGLYEFPFIKYILNGYYAVAHDHTSGDRRNAAIADLITPEPMP